MEKELEDWYKLHEFYFYSGSYETKDLAKYLGVTTRTIQRWLKEQVNPDKNQLILLKRYLEEKSKISD